MDQTAPIARPYRLMALNNAWANATLYTALKPLDAEALAAPAPGFFPSLKGTLNHILIVDLYYLDALEEGGRGPSLRERAEIDDVADLARQQAHADARLARLTKNLDERMLNAPRVTIRKEGPVTETVETLLLHLFQHQIHHRGQVHVQLQSAGIAPPQLDEFYLTYDRGPLAEDYFRQL